MGLRRHLHCFFFFHFPPFHSLSVFKYLLLTSVCFQQMLFFSFPPNEAEDCDSSAFPLSPLTPLTFFTRGVFFPLTFQCTCLPFFSHSLFFSAGLSVVLSVSHIHRQLFSLLSAKTFASVSLSLSLSLCPLSQV